MAGDDLDLVGILSLLLVLLQFDADGLGVAVGTAVEVVFLVGAVLEVLARGELRLLEVHLMQEGRRLRVSKFLRLALKVLPLVGVPFCLRVPSFFLFELEVGVFGLAVEISVVEPERTLILL